MNRYQFEVLTYIEKNGKKDYPMRTLSDTLKISGTALAMATLCCSPLPVSFLHDPYRHNRI